MSVALATPTMVLADVKLSGAIQAEIGGYSHGKWMKEDADYITLTRDTDGVLSNGNGPNRLIFDFDEKLMTGLSAYARYQVDFSTADNKGLGGEEAWLGLKGEGFNIRFGRMAGAYKSSFALVDPFAATSVQASSTAGGMSGAGQNTIAHIKRGDNGLPLYDKNDSPLAGDRAATGTNLNSDDLMTISTGTNHKNLANSGFVPNLLEIGARYAGFSAIFQGVFDQTDEFDGAGLAELRYTHGDPKDPAFIIFAAGSFLDFGESTSNIAKNEESENPRNLKAGGQFNIKFTGDNKLRVGLQYEDAELGTFDNDINPEGGKYLMGSIDYYMGSLALGGWGAGYKSDIEDKNRYIIDGEAVEEDSVSFGVGFKYFFSKKTFLFGGYRQVDSDNDYRDEGVYGVGLRHSF